ncbi:MAG: alpha/beta fold hydrolase [Halobacteria archaeon]|nr:alpha/beta fold hydrolase [Halobacteria archaeon]
MAGRREKDGPVLLVHGYWDTWYMPWWKLLKEHLVDLGYDEGRVHILRMSEVPFKKVGSIKEYAEVVRDGVERAYDDAGEVTVIGHSMGGLDSRWYIEIMGGEDYVDSLVTLSTPHRGTYTTYLTHFTKGGRQMTPHSDFIDRLNEDGLAPSVDYTAMWSSIDPAVFPKRNARLPSIGPSDNTRNIKAGAYLHLEMIWKRAVFNKYKHLL